MFNVVEEINFIFVVHFCAGTLTHINNKKLVKTELKKQIIRKSLTEKNHTTYLLGKETIFAQILHALLKSNIKLFRLIMIFVCDR